MDESSQAQNRRHRRSNVLLKATVQTPAGPIEVVLRNLSQEGALVQSKDLPEEGTRVLFHRQGLCVPSRVAWTHGDCAGLAFDFPLFPRELLRHVPSAGGPKPLPGLSPKRPGLSSRPLTPQERQLIESWAVEAMTAEF